jgi:hypothetical protein
MSMPEEIMQRTRLLREILPNHEVRHKYFGNASPYRWEIHLEVQANQFTWVGTIVLDGPEILRMYAMKEQEQHTFLRAKVADIFGHC